MGVWLHLVLTAVIAEVIYQLHAPWALLLRNTDRSLGTDPTSGLVGPITSAKATKNTKFTPNRRKQNDNSLVAHPVAYLVNGSVKKGNKGMRKVGKIVSQDSWRVSGTSKPPSSMPQCRKANTWHNIMFCVLVSKTVNITQYNIQRVGVGKWAHNKTTLNVLSVVKRTHNTT